MKATGWLPHAVRGFLSGTVAKKMQLILTSSPAGVASVRNIKDTASGRVKAVFHFKNGGESQEAVVSGNRVLYVTNGRGQYEKLDLAQISRISFLQ